jgi:hypothetical protein
VHLAALALFAAVVTAPDPAPAAAHAKDLQDGAKNAPLPVEALCARLTPAEVAAILGPRWVRRPEKDLPAQVCAYADAKEKGPMPVRSFSLGTSRLTEAGWRKFVEVQAKGKVVERDGVLVSHFRRDKFGTDVVWFKDRQGNALELSVNSGVTEAQAVALARSALD